MALRFLFPVAVAGFVWVQAVTLAQQTTFSGTHDGYVFDPAAHSIRKIVGIAPAAVVGDAVVRGVQSAGIAPDGTSAIVAGRGGVRRITSFEPQLHATLLPGALAGFDRILWSGDGGSAVLFASGARLVQFLTGLNGSPVVGAPVLLPSVDSTYSLIAADPAKGVAAICGRSSGSSTAVYFVRADGSIQRTATLNGLVSSGAFTSDGTLFAAVPAARAIVSLSPADSWSSPVSVLGPAQGIDDPVAIAIGNSGTTLLVAERQNLSISVFALATWRRIADLPLDTQPSTLDPFSATTLLVNAKRKAGEPVELLTTGASPMVIFIPDPAATRSQKENR